MANLIKKNWKLICFIVGYSILILIILDIYLSATKTVSLFGKTYKSNISTLDISSEDYFETDFLTEKLSSFPKLKKVVFKDYIISCAEKKSMQKKYPKIDFAGKAICKIYDLEIKENVKSIDFQKVKVDDKLVDYLDYFPNLKSVNLLGQDLTTGYKNKLVKKYPKIDFIWNVTVGGLNVSSDVKSLNLDGVNIANLDAFYKELSLLKNLTYLDMGESNLSNEELAKMRVDFPNVKIAWMIHLGKWQLKTDATAFSVLIVDYNYVRMTSEDIEVLKYCTDLQALDLGHQRITDLSVIGNYLQDLRILILADNRISDITPLAKLKHLHYLELFINPITDYSALANCKELVDLNLCYNRVNDITFLMDLPSLERLWIVGCGINGDNLLRIREKYPDIIMDARGPGSTENGWRGHERYFAMIRMFYARNYIDGLFTKYDKK